MSFFSLFTYDSVHATHTYTRKPEEKNLTEWKPFLSDWEKNTQDWKRKSPTQTEKEKEKKLIGHKRDKASREREKTCFVCKVVVCTLLFSFFYI